MDLRKVPESAGVWIVTSLVYAILHALPSWMNAALGQYNQFATPQNIRTYDEFEQVKATSSASGASWKNRYGGAHGYQEHRTQVADG